MAKRIPFGGLLMDRRYKAVKDPFFPFYAGDNPADAAWRRQRGVAPQPPPQGVFEFMEPGYKEPKRRKKQDPWDRPERKGERHKTPEAKAKERRRRKFKGLKDLVKPLTTPKGIATGVILPMLLMEMFANAMGTGNKGQMVGMASLADQMGMEDAKTEADPTATQRELANILGMHSKLDRLPDAILSQPYSDAFGRSAGGFGMSGDKV